MFIPWSHDASSQPSPRLTRHRRTRQFVVARAPSDSRSARRFQPASLPVSARTTEPCLRNWPGKRNCASTLALAA